MQRHIEGAERLARRSAGSADAAARINRLLLLDELRRYRNRGRFPINHEWRQRAVPHFIDSCGTRCAVAHLMDVSGQTALVEHIAKTNNQARVCELARLPELRAWLNAAGLTLDEAARIQPTYDMQACVDRALVTRDEASKLNEIGICTTGMADQCFCLPSSPHAAIGTVVATNGDTARVRLDQIEAGFPELQVGTEVVTSAVVPPTARSVQVGEQLLLAAPHGSWDSSEGPRVERSHDLTVVDGSVLCQLSSVTSQHAVRVETAVAALRAGGDSCMAILSQEDIRWGYLPDFESDTSCAYAPHRGIGAAELTSLALMAMLLVRRLQRSQQQITG